MSEYFKDYKFNQYEEYNNGIFPYSIQVNARYIEQKISEYRNNPLIEALPPIYLIEQVFVELKRPPMFLSNDSEGSDLNRIQKIKRLENYLFPMIKHFEIECAFSSVLRSGYKDRNIATENFIRINNLDSPVIYEKWKDRIRNDVTILEDVRSTFVPGVFISGIIGAGKSASISNILTLYPQVIVHTEYKGHKFLLNQLVWIKIDCTYSGEVRDICKSIFDKVDNALGTDYYRKYLRTSNVEELFTYIKGIVERHRLGVLIIDEIQNLASAKVGVERAINFIVRMENELKLPIIYIGTYGAIKKVFGKAARAARRASGTKEIIFNRLEKNEEWYAFIEDMWKYQFTNRKCDLTDEIKDILYEKSAGIVDWVLKLFRASQYEAILNGNEQLTASLITEVAEKHMPLSKRIIDAIKNKGTGDKELMEDIEPPNIDVLADNAEAYIKSKDEFEEQFEILKENRELQIEIKKKEIANNIASLVCSIHEITNTEAYRIASAVVERRGINTKMNVLLKETGNEIKNLLIKSATTKKFRKKATANYETTKDKDNLVGNSDDSFRVDDKIKGLDDLF